MIRMGKSIRHKWVNRVNSSFPEGGHSATNHHGPVVQSIVSLTTSLRRHFVKYMLTTLSNPLLFFVEKM